MQFFKFINSQVVSFFLKDFHPEILLGSFFKTKIFLYFIRKRKYWNIFWDYLFTHYENKLVSQIYVTKNGLILEIYELLLLKTKISYPLIRTRTLHIRTWTY